MTKRDKNILAVHYFAHQCVREAKQYGWGEDYIVKVYLSSRNKAYKHALATAFGL